MLQISQYCLVAATILVVVALVAKIVAFSRSRERSPEYAHAQSGAAGGVLLADRPEFASPETGHGAGSGRATGLVWYASRLTWMALAFLTVALVTRMFLTGNAPFTNQHEFAASFAWGILVAYVWVEVQYQARTLGLLVLPFTAGMLVYALAMDTAVRPLMPALQNSWLLTLHVFTAVLAYGGAAVASAAGILYLVRPHVAWRGLPSREVLDEIGYRATLFLYPVLTVMIILGAVWADIAWGRYWSWDPKETAAFVTWLIYSAYLHARVVRDWRGSKAAWLLVLGFAAVIGTFVGNHFFSGLHSYA
ncbi:c-type cytochrome biogenesis protein CcsB [Mobilicoccus massiliensis]|uniref:c-type cytochrome biogenesis protein CcsB n=1 Tax=Mobilicoccus massiliensis TaxID=1522310 RepID=UPI00058D4CBD|nr:c-type cytochrome biogenesis protein CcsB [Mobilicoccus massiliensis]